MNDNYNNSPFKFVNNPPWASWAAGPQPNQFVKRLKSQPPSNLNISVKSFKKGTYIHLTKGPKMYICLKEHEFYDLLANAAKIKKHVRNCNQHIQNTYGEIDLGEGEGMDIETMIKSEKTKEIEELIERKKELIKRKRADQMSDSGYDSEEGEVMVKPKKLQKKKPKNPKRKKVSEEYVSESDDENDASFFIHEDEEAKPLPKKTKKPKRNDN